MIRQPFSLSRFFECLALAMVLLCVAPSAQAAPRRHIRAVLVNLRNTGQTIALPVGEQLVVSVPLKPYNDNYWYIWRNSGAPLKLIAGPDERRGKNWAPWKQSLQVLYFKKEAPGTAHLVLEQNYWSVPMILKVVDQ